jgi:UDP-glucose:(heptosyl)LPS alpha-1,3-glucosyltransferase
MELALCYEKIEPHRGGAERYIADLAGWLVADNHSVHIYASSWDASALPTCVHYHPIREVRGPRFIRPWRFATACARALRRGRHDLSIGFNKTWGQDILYPQGGLHAASAEHNLLKHHSRFRRQLARLMQRFDLAHRSFMLLERRQYLGKGRPVVIVNSNMVKDHFQTYYGTSKNDVRVVRSAIAPERFTEDDRPKRRQECREQWGIAPGETVAVFLAMNYRLKGLEPLLRAVKQLPDEKPFRLLVAGSPRTDVFRRQARRLGIERRVVFAGYCPSPRDCYFAGDFLVHPTFYDPCSLVVLEALACGMPVVTSRYNGAAELLSPPHDGYVIDDPHDHAHLGWCMAQLLDSSRRIACTQAIRRRAGQWTSAHHYRQLQQIFADVVRRRHAA